MSRAEMSAYSLMAGGLAWVFVGLAQRQRRDAYRAK
jgi:hypothetical protein